MQLSRPVSRASEGKLHEGGPGACPLLYPYRLERCLARAKIFVERKDDLISLGWGPRVCHVQSSTVDSDSSRGGIPSRYDWVSSFLLLDGKPKAQQGALTLAAHMLKFEGDRD